jgi:hypothetical protein
MIKYKLGDIIEKERKPYGDSAFDEDNKIFTIQDLYLVFRINNKLVPLRLEEKSPNLRSFEGTKLSKSSFPKGGGLIFSNKRLIPIFKQTITEYNKEYFKDNASDTFSLLLFFGSFSLEFEKKQDEDEKAKIENGIRKKYPDVNIKWEEKGSRFWMSISGLDKYFK